jgi:peptide/nickel transport system ATP-binding protein
MIRRTGPDRLRRPADEPTTGLDRGLADRTADEPRRHVDSRDRDGGTGQGLLTIAHDLAAAERIADRAAVMYAGRIVLRVLPGRAFTPTPRMSPELGYLPDGGAPRGPAEVADEGRGVLRAT